MHIFFYLNSGRALKEDRETEQSKVINIWNIWCNNQGSNGSSFHDYIKSYKKLKGIDEKVYGVVNIISKKERMTMRFKICIIFYFYTLRKISIPRDAEKFCENDEIIFLLVIICSDAKITQYFVKILLIYYFSFRKFIYKIKLSRMPTIHIAIYICL